MKATTHPRKTFTSVMGCSSGPEEGKETNKVQLLMARSCRLQQRILGPKKVTSANRTVSAIQTTLLEFDSIVG